MRHHGPFLGSDFFNMFVDQGLKSASRLLRQCSGENEDTFERAGFLSNRRNRAVIVIPNLRRSEHHKKRKECAQRRQHGGGERSSAPPQGGRKFDDDGVDHRCTEVSAAEEHKSHPPHWEGMQPITQYFLPARDCLWSQSM